METGQVKQVAAFEQLLGFCNAHGPKYNPGKPSLSLTAMSGLLSSARESMEAVKTLRTAYDNAVNQRKLAFAELPKFITRIVNTLASTNATRATVDDAYFFVNRFRSARRKGKPVAKDDQAETPVLTTARRTSYFDFDSKVDNFEALVNVLSAEPHYTPNETELQVSSLEALATNLRSLNSAVINAYVALNNARASRDRILYYDEVSIHPVARDVKRYIKGAFGFKSIEYQQVRGIRFTKKRLK